MVWWADINTKLNVTVVVTIPIVYILWEYFKSPVIKGPTDEQVDLERKAARQRSDSTEDPFVSLPTKQREPRQTNEEHSQYLFKNVADSRAYCFTESPEVNETDFLSQYILQTAELVEFTDIEKLKEHLQRLTAVQAKSQTTFFDFDGDAHELEGRTLSCEYLFGELNLIRDAVHKLYDEESRPYSLAKYPTLTRKSAETDLLFR